MKSFTRPTRVWINQASTLQKFHNYNGKVGIAIREENGKIRIYFATGDLISMFIDEIALSTNNSQTNIFQLSTNERRICASCNQEMKEDEIVTETQGINEGLKVHYSCLRRFKQ